MIRNLIKLDIAIDYSVTKKLFRIKLLLCERVHQKWPNLIYLVISSLAMSCKNSNSESAIFVSL